MSHSFGKCPKCGFSLISSKHIPCTIEARDKALDQAVTDLRAYRPLSWAFYPPSIGDVASFVVSDRKAIIRKAVALIHDKCEDPLVSAYLCVKIEELL